MKHFSIRLNDEVYNNLVLKAQQNGITPTDLARDAITEYLNKDINLINDVLGSISYIHDEIHEVERSMKLFTSLFTYWLKYYFSDFAGDYDQVAKESRKYFFQRGDELKNDFIKTFRQENKETINLIEGILGDFLMERKANG